MRAGMTQDWPAALDAFDATHYTNRLGITDVRADEPADVQAALAAAGAPTIAWYGVRLFTDHWAAEEPPADFAPFSLSRSRPGVATPTERSPP